MLINIMRISTGNKRQAIHLQHNALLSGCVDKQPLFKDHRASNNQNNRYRKASSGDRHTRHRCYEKDGLSQFQDSVERHHDP